MSVPLIDVLGGVSEIGGHLLELYRLRRDGTFFEQQRFLSDLRMEEAAAAESRALERDQELAQLRASEAARDLEGSYQLEVRRAQLKISTWQELDRRKLLRNYVSVLDKSIKKYGRQVCPINGYGMRR